MAEKWNVSEKHFGATNGGTVRVIVHQPKSDAQFGEENQFVLLPAYVNFDSWGNSRPRVAVCYCFVMLYGDPRRWNIGQFATLYNTCWL